MAKKAGNKKKDEVKVIEVPEDPVEEAVRPEYRKTLQEIRGYMKVLTQAVSKREKRLQFRVLRKNNAVRRKLCGGVLTALVAQFYPDAAEFLNMASERVAKDVAANEAAELQFNSDVERIAKETAEKQKARAKLLAEKEKEALLSMDKDDQEKYHKEKAEKKKKQDEAKKKKEAAAQAALDEEKKLAEKPAAVLPETSAYVTLLITLWLLDQKLDKEAAAVTTRAIADIEEANRRTLDLLSEKLYFYFSLAHERTGALQSIRQRLLLSHRTACLQHNEPAQCMLTALILRNYVAASHYNQADKFRLATTFPVSRSNNVHARYLYYTGMINTVQLHYSEAHANLTQAIRKAPQTGALGFRQQATKLSVIIQLLMGDIPERSVFRQKGLARSLEPYFKLAQSVRVGDLRAFMAIMKDNQASFVADGFYSLIVRLRHNVIKTGLRKINLSYSRISMADICAKLRLESEEDAEYIVAKAIHDGVVDAVIDRQERCMFSKEHVDVYSTTEPQDVFNKRIQFCMDTHNEAVKAMSYPLNAHKRQSQLDDEVEQPVELDLDDEEDEL